MSSDRRPPAKGRSNLQDVARFEDLQVRGHRVPTHAEDGRPLREIHQAPHLAGSQSEQASERVGSTDPEQGAGISQDEGFSQVREEGPRVLAQPHLRVPPEGKMLGQTLLAPPSRDQRGLPGHVFTHLGEGEGEQSGSSGPARQRLADPGPQVKGRAPRDQAGHADLPIHESLHEQPGILEMLCLLEEERDRPLEGRLELGEEERG